MPSLYALSSWRMHLGFPGGSAVKNPPAKAGDGGLIPGLGKPPGEGNGNPLQYSCLVNPMDSPWGHKDLDTTEWLSSNTPHESPSSLVCILHYCYCSQVILLRCIRMLKLHSCFFQFSPGAFSTWRTALSVSTVVVLMLDILFVLIWDVSTSISFLSYTFLELKET